MNSETMRATLRVTKALADPQRMRILMMLEPGELCVCQIVEVLGLAPSTVSKHLSLLAEADLIISRKDGRWAFYQLAGAEAGLLAKTLLDGVRAALCDDRQIMADRDSLSKVLACDPVALCKRQRLRD